MFVNYSLETTQNIPETIVLNLDYHGSISNVVCDCDLRCHNYDDVIIGAMASQITSLTIVYSAVYSDADQTKHQSSAPLAVVRGIHRGPMNSQHQWPVTRKMFPFDDVIMILSHIWRLHMLWCCMGTESFETIRRSVSWIWLVLANGQVQVHGAVSWWRHQMETFSALLALCHSRLIPMYNTRFILWPSSLSSPQSLATDMRRLFYSTWPPSFSSHIKKEVLSNRGGERRWPQNKTGVVHRYQAT